ncbi:TetR/AcrR family transcriptional regulator [Azospirillum sp. TSO22-1]|uniref:TetR/AcrR family transcriptional regulator n=1 Tax=Azospirillum sp. TSO22-1 TaxID=716789 RepID=UPI0018EEB001|nr:TetR/AcrR family transcriptional regulator [Azospirillum sp. TSO22-1]
MQRRAWRTILTIFEATAQILERDGEKALTTNRVAERAGFSIGTLYQYFPSMDAILLAMIDLERRRVIRELERLLDDAEATGGHPRDVVRPFVRALVAAFGTGDGARRLLLKRGWLLDHTPQVVAATQEMAARIHAALARRAHPDVPPPAPAALFVMTRAVLGAIRAAVLEDSPLPETPEFEDALVRMSLTMLESTDGKESPYSRFT